MSSNKIETKDVNGSRLAGQGPLFGRCSLQRNIGRHHANPVISKKKVDYQENEIVMECYLLSEPKIRGYRKRMLSLWLQKGTFCVIVEEAISVEALPDHVGEVVRSVLPEMGAEEQADSLDEEEDVRNVLPEMGAEEQSK